MFEGLLLGGFGLRLRHVKLLVLGWLLSEVLLLMLVVRMLGFGGAVLLGIVTSLLGVMALRRLGLNATRTLRTAMAGREAPDGAVLDGVLGALGGLLLILPGFISDLVGLALITPSVRQSLRSRLGPPRQETRNGQARTSGVIDLAPNEWSVVDRPHR